MKIVLALFCLVAASSAAEFEIKLVGNHLEALVTEALEYIRSLLKKHDPYVLPSMPDQTLVDSDINFVISASDVKLSKASDFTIDTIKIDPLTLKANFKVTLPEIYEEGNYKISGTGWGKKVDGSGYFRVDVTNFVQSGQLQLNVVDHSLQVQDLSLDYSLGDYKVSVDGLSIEGMTSDEINDLLNKKLLDYLNNNKSFVEQHTAEQVKSIANKILKGHNLADVIAWLEKLDASTPDPPPFTFGPLAV